MHPTEVIEFIVVVGIIVVIIIISFLLKGNWRKLGQALALVVLVAYCLFFIARPNWIDSQIEKKVYMLEPYLEQKYPKDDWMITTVPHRENGYKHLNPYYIGVIFENEPEVTYHFWVDENNIYQISYSTDKSLDELMYKDSK
ncbi:hypothetical protein [Halalkalibacter hemicellulosilyticus]|uniref:DUF3139 domain-containing protein n=1 Tax=Halalkalibacter hemicellulosilyticusJCM 9152 TaxID=1236971 RepID=W4QCL3_9BACI|nr:hypothetical protein [Halalkalibacter hemicellulosilyticus]GAE29796.1 hypothetical protein JCM9152_1180 [Halalkalibacter hemicellulosilyticusJCM 9152]